jgi:O-methyltransferase involved in polyketide biosynthesis
MNEVNKTLYIPLYGKALVSRRGIILQDPKAEEIWEKEGFALKGKSRSKWLALYMSMRSAVFDRWLKQRMDENPDAVILHIGCGMDSRILRVGNRQHLWYDVDFPEVIEQRKKHYAPIPGYSMIASDARDPAWLQEIPANRSAIVVMEGISMYMDTGELTAVLSNLKQHFTQVQLLMDCYTTVAAKASKYRNPINDVGVTTVCGLDDPKILETSGLAFLAEHRLTPDDMIDELTGMEKWIFRNLYAGAIAQAMYRLYEFRG